MKYNYSCVKPSLLEETIHLTETSHFRDGKLACPYYENAFIQPWTHGEDGESSGGVVTEDGKLVVSSTITEDLLKISNFNRSEAVQTNHEVILIGNFIPIWGHIITDSLKKLWFLRTDEFRRLSDKGVKLVYITHYDKPLPNYAAQFLLLAGLDICICERIEALTQFKRIYIPDNSIIFESGIRYWYIEYKNIIEEIKAKVQPNVSYPKLYFSRTRLEKGRDFGEGIIEREFKNAGYEIVAPQLYTPSEQIAMLEGCTHFAATEGSISHNAVFCNKGTRIAIVRKCDYVNPYQILINELAGIEVTYIDANRSSKADKNRPWIGPFYLCVTKELENFFGYKIMHLPYWMNPTWLWYNTSQYQWAHWINALFHRIKKLINK